MTSSPCPPSPKGERGKRKYSKGKAPPPRGRGWGEVKNEVRECNLSIKQNIIYHIFRIFLCLIYHILKAEQGN
jgi:hypothetical protein